MGEEKNQDEQKTSIWVPKETYTFWERERPVIIYSLEQIEVWSIESLKMEGSNRITKRPTVSLIHLTNIYGDVHVPLHIYVPFIYL